MSLKWTLVSRFRPLVSWMTPRDLLLGLATFSLLTIYVTFQLGPAHMHHAYLEPNLMPQMRQVASTPDPDNWLLLLCMSFSDGDSGLCMEKKEIALLRRYQRVNRLPGIYDVLCRKDALCAVMNEAKRIPGLGGDGWYPLCFILPAQYQQFVEAARIAGDNAQWLLKPHSSKSGYSSPRVFDIFSPGGQEELQRYKTKKAIVQQMVNNPLTIFNRSVSLRFYVLITSLVPLRVYLHHNGILYHRHDQARSYRKIPGRAWPLSQFWRYLMRIYGEDDVQESARRLDQMIVQTLLIAESFLVAKFPVTSDERKYAKSRCPHCFQLLGVDVVFNQTLWPKIIDINGQPNLRLSSKEGNFKANLVKRSVVEDMVSLLFTPSSVAPQVADSLENLSANFGILGINCQTSHNLCLSVDDLEYIMQNHRELLNCGGFQQIFPGADPGRHAALVEGIHRWAASGMDNNKTPETTASKDIIAIMSVLKKYSLDLNRAWKDVNVSAISAAQKSHSANISTNAFTDASKPNVLINTTETVVGNICSKDPTTMPYLSSIVTLPALSLSPVFSPLVTDYSTTVPYDTLLVRVGAITENCQAEVRIDDKYGPAGFTNYTIGVGDNKIVFHVVDISHKSAWIVNTYYLSIRRLAVTHGEEPFDPALRHQVCGLTQECDMQVSPTEPCGVNLDSTRSRDWTSFMSDAAGLPLCTTGDAHGRWVLPCRSCSRRTSCFWREAIWHPYTCRHPVLSKDTLAQCLAYRKLLFIGDSTNRGMMEYIMERLNGTLTEWDKTHDIRVYSNLNGGRTAVSFAYYPQFWLPTKDRPVFEKAVYQLVQKSRPVYNNSSTVLVVGGVHWLATQHLLMLLKALKVERLQGMKLFVKSLGSGFHQMVEGLRSLSLEEQRKLLFHNRDLSYFAKHYDFEVVDTFNMTVSRYKDFLQGKCACHFHKVVEVQGIDTHRPWQTHRSGRKQSRFHVDGSVNAIYSEILLGRICSDYVER